MNYKVRIGEEIFSVDAGRVDETGSCHVTVRDAPRSVVVSAASSDHFHLRVDGEAFNVFVAPSESGAWVWCEGRARFVEDADLVPRRRGHGGMAAPTEVTPPTPAAVMRILVEVGHEVKKGQGLVVVSAMKMEMTLAAPYSGRVSAINTEVGAQVSPGQILVEIEPATEDTENE